MRAGMEAGDGGDARGLRFQRRGDNRRERLGLLEGKAFLEMNRSFQMIGPKVDVLAS